VTLDVTKLMERTRYDSHETLVTKPVSRNSSEQCFVQQLAEPRSLPTTRLYHTLTLSQSYAPRRLFTLMAPCPNVSALWRTTEEGYLLRSKWPSRSGDCRSQRQKYACLHLRPVRGLQVDRKPRRLCSLARAAPTEESQPSLRPRFRPRDHGS